MLIAFGIITRVAALFQIPILVGAIAFVNADKGFFSLNSELEYSILVLALLVFFLLQGSGTYSFDRYLRTHKEG